MLMMIDFDNTMPTPHKICRIFKLDIGHYHKQPTLSNNKTECGMLAL